MNNVAELFLKELWDRCFLLFGPEYICITITNLV